MEIFLCTLEAKIIIKVKKNFKKFGGWLTKELNCNLKVFVDTAPIMEKNIAEIAGIGWQGKHSNIVSKNIWFMVIFIRNIFRYYL